MTKLVLTIVHGEAHEKIAEVTHPEMKRYAKRVGAKFCCSRFPEFPYSPPWMKFLALYDLLEQFDRILFIDNDALVNADECPDLFEVVPEGVFGAYFEGRVADRTASMTHGCNAIKQAPTRLYDGDYLNSGLMTLSRMHRDLFVWPDKIEDNYYEQGLLNARVFSYEVPVMMLDYKFNRMSVVDNITGEERHAAHIVHFAGSNDKPRVIQGMKEDLERWKNKTPAISRFYVAAEGGIGDVVEAEPVMRYAIEELYGNDPNVHWTIAVTWPRILAHFRKYPNVRVVERRIEEDDDGLPYTRWSTHPPVSHHARMYFPYHCIHNQDYAAYSMLKNVLDPDKKTIQLEVTDAERTKLQSLLPDKCTGFPIAVHAGGGWASKTFPLDWWQAVVDGLAAKGFEVRLFGKGNYVKVQCPAGGVDLRDQLTLGEMFALIEDTPILLSNDSSPIHIGGAFNNWIVQISTCKRPHLVFPFRHGTEKYRTKSVHRHLTVNGLNIKPNVPHAFSIADVVGDVRDYLPEPLEVLSGCMNIRSGESLH